MSDTESLDESMPQKQIKKQPIDEDEVKAKKPRTEAQIKAFQRCLELKKEKVKKRNDEAQRLAEYDKKALEAKVVAKAISIKKKQIKKQSALDEISDEEDVIEVVKEKPVKPVLKPVPAKLSFTFI